MTSRRRSCGGSSITTQPQMTAHYARLSRHHRPPALGEGPQGQRRGPDRHRSTPTGRSAEAAWAKQRLGRATQALPNGYCGLPGAEDLPARQRLPDLPDVRHHARVPAPAPRAPPAGPADHLRRRGPRAARLAEMNQQVAGNLDNDHHRPRSRARPGPEGGRRCVLTTPATSRRRPARHELTRAKAIQALRELDARAARHLRGRGQPRPGLPVLALHPARHPGRDRAAPPATSTPGTRDTRPVRQRASDASLRARLDAANERNRQLAEENRRLRASSPAPSATSAPRAEPGENATRRTRQRSAPAERPARCVHRRLINDTVREESPQVTDPQNRCELK